MEIGLRQKTVVTMDTTFMTGDVRPKIVSVQAIAYMQSAFSPM